MKLEEKTNRFRLPAYDATNPLHVEACKAWEVLIACKPAEQRECFPEELLRRFCMAGVFSGPAPALSGDQAKMVVKASKKLREAAGLIRQVRGGTRALDIAAFKLGAGNRQASSSNPANPTRVQGAIEAAADYLDAWLNRARALRISDGPRDQLAAVLRYVRKETGKPHYGEVAAIANWFFNPGDPLAADDMRDLARRRLPKKPGSPPPEN